MVKVAQIKVVYGAPCSGKTTYVKESIEEGDIVIDLDYLKHALTYKDYHADLEDGELDYIWDLRNYLIENPKLDSVTWLISTVVVEDKELGAFDDIETIEMEKTKEEIYNYIDGDDSRSDKEFWKGLVDEWFEKDSEVSQNLKKQSNIKGGENMKGKDKKMWQIKQAAEPNTLDMYIYGDVEGDYYDWWNDREIKSETSANHFREELNKYPDVTQINIYINSYGGSVFEGTAIYSQLKRHAAFKTVYVDGFACSIASVIAMAGDKVIMPSNTLMMIHNAMQGVFGNSEQLRKAADNLDTIMEGNRQAYIQKSNGKISEDKLKELLKTDTWLTAEQCVEYGFADELLEKEVDLTDARQMLQKANLTIEQQLNYNKALVAQVKEFTEVLKVDIEHDNEVEETEIVETEVEEKEPEVNKPKQLLSALFR